MRYKTSTFDIFIFERHVFPLTKSKNFAEEKNSFRSRTCRECIRINCQLKFQVVFNRSELRKCIEFLDERLRNWRNFLQTTALPNSTCRVYTRKRQTLKTKCLYWKRQKLKVNNRLYTLDLSKGTTSLQNTANGFSYIFV